MTPRRRLALVLAWILVLGPAVLSAVSAPSRVEVPRGTPLEVAPQVDVDSGSAKVGDQVAFVVKSPVVVQGVKLVAAGAPGRGAVVYSRPARVAGRGELMVRLLDVQGVDGSWIPVGVRQGDQTGLAGLIPDVLMDLTEPQFPRGCNGLLSSRRLLDAWTLEPRAFAVRSGKVAAAPLSAPANLKGKKILVPSGTLFQFRPLADVVSGQVVVGDRVKFAVVETVVVQGQPVIQAGAPALGTVLRAVESGAANKSGELVVSLDAVQGVDGRWLPAHSYQGDRGDANRLISLGVNLVVPLAGFAVSGRQAVISRDTVVTGGTSYDRLVVVPPGTKPAAPLVAPAPTPSPSPSPAPEPSPFPSPRASPSPWVWSSPSPR